MQDADLYIRSSIMDIQDRTSKSSKLVYLYPHGADCLSVIVPRSQQHKLFLVEFARSHAIWAIGISFLLFTVVRCAITGEGLFPSFIGTLATLLAQNFRLLQQTRSKYLWMVFVLIFAIISTNILSSILYLSLVNFEYTSEIDTMEQLDASGLTILVEDARSDDNWNFGKYCYFNLIK